MSAADLYKRLEAEGEAAVRAAEVHAMCLTRGSRACACASLSVALPSFILLIDLMCDFVARVRD